MKIKIYPLALFLSLSSLLLGQKKIEYGISIGVFAGVNAERFFLFQNNSFGFGANIISSIDETPSVLAGVTIATHLSKKGNQLRAGSEIHHFRYIINSSSFISPATFVTNLTNTTNQVLHFPIGYCRKRGNQGFIVYLGSGLAVFSIKDVTSANERAAYTPEHRAFLKKTFDNFKKIYPIYELSVGWRWQHSSLELSYRGSGKLIKEDFISDVGNNNGGNRSILCLGTKLFL